MRLLGTAPVDAEEAASLPLLLEEESADLECVTVVGVAAGASELSVKIPVGFTANRSDMPGIRRHIVYKHAGLALSAVRRRTFSFARPLLLCSIDEPKPAEAAYLLAINYKSLLFVRAPVADLFYNTELLLEVLLDQLPDNRVVRAKSMENVVKIARGTVNTKNSITFYKNSLVTSTLNLEIVLWIYTKNKTLNPNELHT